MSWFGEKTASNEVSGSDKDYPKLSSVPERPPPPNEEARKQMAQGLVADRDSARYTDETLRRVEPVTAPPPRSVVASATTAPPAPPQQAASSAPTRSGSPPAAPREPVRSEPVPAPSPQSAAPPPPQVAAAPPPTSQVTTAPPAPPRQAVPPPAVAPPPAPEIVAMAPIRSPGDPTPSGASAARGSAPSNLVWEAPPADIDLMAGSRAPAAATAALPVAGGGPVASILFASGSARLGTSDESRLRQVADIYRRSGGTVSVVGHASAGVNERSNVRRQIANFSVSMDRANVVAQALQRYGVPSAAIAISAQADTIAANDADGRRADVFLLR